MASRVLKGAIVGFGQVAEKAHAPAFLGRPDFKIIAVAEEAAPRASAARSVFPDAKVYSTLNDLLSSEKDLDFVDIATPPFLHGKQALAALRRGLHVLCEKPLTLDPAEFAALKREASSQGRALFTVHNWAYSPQWLKIFELADGQALGELREVELRVLRTQPAASAVPGDWRRDARLSGGGILVDHGWHNLYLIHRLLGRQAEGIVAELPPGTRAEDEADVALAFPRAAARLHLTWKASARSNSAVIRGSRAALELKDDSLVVSSTDGACERMFFAEKLSAGSAHPQWFQQMLADFKAAAALPAARARNLDEAEFCLNAILSAYRCRGALPA